MKTVLFVTSRTIL